MKRAAPPHLALSPEPTLHQRGEATRDGQAESGASVAAGGGTVGLREGFEDRLKLLPRDPDPRVLDGHMEHHVVRALAPHVHLNRHVAALGELDGIPGQVEDDLPEATRVADERVGNLRRHGIGELQALAVCADSERLARPGESSYGHAIPPPPPSPRSPVARTSGGALRHTRRTRRSTP
jgi:hypothetical protein